jgi:hypothetical protein
MKKILLFALLFPSIAYAGDEQFDCHKSHKLDHAVECGYVASVIVHTHNGKTEHFYAM